MAISYVSTAPLKSNPYVLPVNLDLMAKVLTFKETSFKNNAAKIQQQFDSAYTTDLIKYEDKDYLNQQINNTIEQVNGLGGIDLSNINAVNQISGLASSIYQDGDIIESISSTQKVRSLQNSYDKLKTDPKNKGLFATQNYEYDMQNVNSWLNSGRTTKSNGYNGPTSATPFVDIDKAAVESAKLVKESYTKHSEKDGIYIHNITKKEITADELKNQVLNTINQNPQYLKQAEINSWYLNRGVSAGDLKTNYVATLEQKYNSHKKIYDDYMKDYEAASTEQKIAMSDNLEILKNNMKTFESAYKNAQNTSESDYEKNKSVYRTNLYLDNMANHIASSMSYREYSDEVKPDLASAAFLKNQIEVAKLGGELVRDPSTASGYSVIGIKPNTGKKTSTGTTNSSTPGYLGTIGQLAVGLNNEDKEKLKYDDAKVTQMISDKNLEKQIVFQDLLKDLVNSNPNLAKLYGTDQSISLLVDKYKKLNNPNVFEIEDLKGAKSSFMTPQQSEYIEKLWKSFELIQKGEKPILDLTPSQIDKLSNIHTINQENDFLTELRNKSMGVGNESLTQSEAEALFKKEQIKKPKVLFSTHPLNLSKSEAGWAALSGIGLPALAYDSFTEIQRGGESGKNLNILHVIEKDGKYIPADGTSHTYTTTFMRNKNDNKIPTSSSITIPANGISKDELSKYFNSLKDNVVIKNGLNEVQLVETKDQQDLILANKKLATPNLVKKDPNAYDVLKRVNQYFNYAIPSTVEEQSKDGVLNMLKTGIIREAELGSVPIYSNGKLVEGRMSFNPYDLTKSYISRIGSSSSDPNDIEAEIVLISKGKKGAPDSEGRRIYKKLSKAEQEQLGIYMPSREQQLKQLQIDYSGRTKPMILKPEGNFKDSQIALPVEIVKTGDNEYTPQIKIPLTPGGKLEYVFLSGGSFPNLAGTTVFEAEQRVRDYLTTAYKLAGVKNNESLFNTILSHNKSK